ncbi:MAG TPA: polysaccharide biosynthesis/export family protein [Candidatus Polarisedimenticolia bacterium]|nr:polysaccharide biosynthesis/export family protein [Candidatus Polarisedimenticolia bacterium]
MPRRHAGLRTVLFAVSAALVPGCASAEHQPVTMAVPAAEARTEPAESSAPPTFEKVPDQENTALVQPQPAGALPAGGPYLLEVEDKLDISVYGEMDLQHVEIPVRPDGMISFTFIGDVLAAGRTIEEVREEMTRRLGQYLRSPQVTVIAKEFAQKKVFVGGEVKSPGILYLGGKEGTLLDALYKVGLTTSEASLDGAYIMRGNRLVAADFKGLVKGDITRNVRLMDQDIIFVPENVNRYVYVVGEVRTNTALEIGDPIPIIQVITRAGGLTNYAKRKEIAVIRGGLKTPEVAIVNAKLLMQGDFNQNILVKPGDIVYVATNALGKYSNFIDVILRTISPVVQATIVSNTVNP